MSKRKIHEYLDRLSEILEYMVGFVEELFSGKSLHEAGYVVQYYDFLISNTSLSPWGSIENPLVWFLSSGRNFTVWSIVDGKLIVADFNENALQGDYTDEQHWIYVQYLTFQDEPKYRGNMEALRVEAERIFSLGDYS